MAISHTQLLLIFLAAAAASAFLALPPPPFNLPGAVAADTPPMDEPRIVLPAAGSILDHGSSPTVSGHAPTTTASAATTPTPSAAPPSGSAFDVPAGESFSGDDGITATSWWAIGAAAAGFVVILLLVIARTAPRPGAPI